MTLKVALTRIHRCCLSNSFHGVTGHDRGNSSQILTCNYPPQARKKQGAVFHPSDSHCCICTNLFFLSEICSCDFLFFFLILFRLLELTKQRGDAVKGDSVMACSVNGLLLRFLKRNFTLTVGSRTPKAQKILITEHQKHPANNM